MDERPSNEKGEGLEDFVAPTFSIARAPAVSPLFPDTGEIAPQQVPTATAPDNKIENWTRSAISLLVVVTAMIVGVMAIKNNMPIPTLVSGAFFGVMGYFFGATKT